MNDAILSADRLYRYTLWRDWIGGEGYALLMGLNPSTADESVNDNTIGREVGFAKSWGYNALAKWNLFGFRATKPKDMRAAADPVGPDNDRHLLDLARGASKIVACWGAGGAFMGRDKHVLELLKGFNVWALAFTKDGQPGHPLYLRKDLTPQLWLPARLETA